MIREAMPIMEAETLHSTMWARIPITLLVSILPPPSISFSNAGGTLGIHASVIQFDGLDFDNDHGFTLGANFRFNRQGDGFWTKALNGLNLMGEYYDGVVNVGGNYAVWKDRINLTASLYDGKYWSMGLYFRVCLK